MRNDEILRDKIKGALTGVAYGDSFGMPVEMWSRKKINSAYGEIKEHLPGNQENAISKGFQAYEVTDDTMNTVLVINMLTNSLGEVDAMEFIRLLRRWAGISKKSSSVIGPSTAKAIERIEAGVPMEETGLTGYTNGAAMKIIPLGLLHNMDHIQDMVQDVVKLCLPTHYTSVAISGAAAVAAAVCYGLNDGADLSEMFSFSKKAADMGVLYGNQIGGPSISARLELIRQYTIEHTKSESLEFIIDIIGTGLPIEESAVAAIAFAYLSEGNPKVCAEYAVNAGGDTDTVAAMACGICGALCGMKAFDTGDVEKIEKTNELSFDELTQKMIDARCLRYDMQ